MKNFSFKSIAPHLIAVAIFALIAVIYLNPLLQGKQLKQGDIIHFTGAAKEIVDYRATTGHEALWTNRMFGGMPAFQISVVYASDLVKYVDQLFHLGLPHPAGLIFIYFIGFYILLLVMRIDPKLSIVGAIAFGFSSFFFIVLIAGHNTQALAIGYMAPVIAGVILCFRGRYVLGGALSALFLALELNANHVQMTFYLMLIILVLGVVEFISKLKEKKLKDFFIAAMVLVAALILAAGTNVSNLWATYEYGKYTTRGQSELTNDKGNMTSGLDKDYATDWSYGKMESFTLLIPNYMGGESGGELSKSSESYKMLTENQIEGKESIIKSMPTYWGPVQFTSGPVYVGAIVVFLFILGFFLIKGRLKWWLIAATVLSLCLAWGRNFMWFSDLFFDYFPGYNKFRSVSFTLVIAEVCMPLLGFLALKKFFSESITKEVKLKALKYAGGITLGIIVVFGFCSGAFFDFVSQYDQDKKLPQWLLAALQSDRHSLLLSDSLRSFVFIALAIVLLWLYITQKLKNQTIVIAILGLLIISDMWMVDKRYLNNSSFESKSKAKQEFTPSKCDEFILKDNEKDFRVFNLDNPFNDANTSYYHNSIGGYHGAKLKRYKELIDTMLTNEMMMITKAFSTKPIDSSVFATMKKVSALNMLNTKYIIYNPEAPPIENPNKLGNAWFVDRYKLAANADSELCALKTFNPATTAIIDKRYESFVANYKNKKDSTATIKLASYGPNDLVYDAKITKDQLTVFSEIYYDKGWNVYLDGKLTPYFRANYVLRAMVIPAGTKKIEWKFEPAVYYTGEKVSLAFNILLILVVIGGFYYEFRNRNKNQVIEATEEL